MFFRKRLTEPMPPRTQGHYVYDGISGGVDSDVADIVLESKQKKLRLGAKHIFKQGQGQASYSVAFTAYPLSHTCKGGPNTADCAGAGAACIRSSDCCSRQCVPGEDAWYNLKTGKRATNIEMLDALTAVSALKIRKRIPCPPSLLLHPRNTTCGIQQTLCQHHWQQK